MVNAQVWLDRSYPTAGAKAAVRRIGPKEDAMKRIGYDLGSLFTNGGDILATLALGIESVTKNQIDENLNLEGPLSLKGFFNLEELDVDKQKITALDLSDCSKLRYLSCSHNQISNLDLSNNRQLAQIGFENNQLTDIDLTGLNKIEKIFCGNNKLTSLKFLEVIDPHKMLTLRMENNKFPPQDLSFFSRFTHLKRLFISGNPFYGSLKPLRNLYGILGIGVDNTDIDSGLEYLPDGFFNINKIGLGGNFSRTLFCTGKLADQLKDYKIGDGEYNWEAWKEHHKVLIENAREQDREQESIPQITFNGENLLSTEDNITSQINDITNNNQDELTQKKLEMEELLFETNTSLAQNQSIIENLSTKNQELLTELARLEDQITNYTAMQLIKEQLNKNELIIKEKKEIIEKLKEKAIQIEEEIANKQD